MSFCSQNRLNKLVSHLTPTPVNSESDYVSSYRSKLRACQKELVEFIDRVNCNPILVRLAWHDSGTYDRTIKSFPECGGANGSIRFSRELQHGANAGLGKAIKYLQPFKDKYPEISWADLIQLASVTAIEHSGGPKIPIKFGRVDTETEDQCPPEGNLPSANPPFPDKSSNAAIHLRRIFYRMGFNDQEIVALSGAHTLGRAFKDRSGTVKEGYGNKNGTRYTSGNAIVRDDNSQGQGMGGGRSWTSNWLAFDNSYFFDDNSLNRNEIDTNQLLKLSTDKVLFVDPTFKRYQQLYAQNRSLFIYDYIKAHTKLSELGSKFTPFQGFYL